MNKKASSTGGYRKGLNICQSVESCRHRYFCKRNQLLIVRLCRLKRWMKAGGCTDEL